MKTLLGKQVKILFKNVVRLETKGDKTENRVLVCLINFVQRYRIISIYLSLSRCFRHVGSCYSLQRYPPGYVCLDKLISMKCVIYRITNLQIDCHFHYLEVQALESKRGNQLSITFNDKVYSFLTGDDSTCSQEVDSMVSALATAIRNIFPTVPLQYIIRKVNSIFCFSNRNQVSVN